MKIDSFNVTTNAQRSASSVEYAKQSFTMLKETSSQPPANEGVQVDLSSQQADQVQQKTEDAISKQAKQMKTEHPLMLTNSTPIATDPDDLRIKLLESMLYSLTGRRIKVSNPAINLQGNSQNERIYRRMAELSSQAMQSQQEFQSFATRNYRIETEHYKHESENVTYQAQGQIKTADGKTINVDIALNMSRSFTSYTKTSVELESKLVDPLVINYEGTAASLSGERFSFDLDYDGQMDDIYFAGKGSGFLALDKNGDGKINDGSELFGPTSGSGFAELSAHDGDGNGWIDENDDVWNHLLVWTKDSEGNDVMYSLKDLGIGAIYLGETDTEFSVKDEDNNTKGVVRSTSFFLKEDGSAGTVQHIDLSL